MYELAKGPRRGVEEVFAPGSVVASGGGAKGIVLPPDCRSRPRVLRRRPPVHGLRHVRDSALHWPARVRSLPRAALGDPLVLDPDTNEPPPRRRAAGRAAFYDPGLWPTGAGSCRATRSPSTRTPCPCGRTTSRSARDRALQREAGRRSHHLRGDAAAPARGHRLPEGDRVMIAYPVPIVLRGQLVEDDLVSFGGRSGGAIPGARSGVHIERLPLPSPMDMADLYSSRSTTSSTTSTARARARPRRQQARPGRPRGRPAGGPAARGDAEERLPVLLPGFARVSCSRSPTPRRHRPPRGWVEQKLVDGRAARTRLRLTGADIPPGNGGLVSGVRSSATWSPAATPSSTPSNDPLTAVAIARTLAEVDPDHPLTKHLAVGYWKGGDTDVEARLYRPDTSRRSWPGAASPR